MAVAMSGATYLLLGLALSILHVPARRVQRADAERRDTRELEVQLVTLEPQHDESRAKFELARPPAATHARTTSSPGTVSLQLATQPREVTIDADTTLEPAAALSDMAAPTGSTGAQSGGGTSLTSAAGTTAVLEIMPFGEGMTPPRLIAGESPHYTVQALASRIEGKTLIRCVIEETGHVRDCLVLKLRPPLDRAAVRTLLANRYAPATFRGRPVSVKYLFTFDFKLP